MSDIVERLRDYGRNPMVQSEYSMVPARELLETADEIERLRAAMALREEDHRRKTAEIERLRGFAEWITESYDSDEWPAQKDIVAGAREALGDE